MRTESLVFERESSGDYSAAATVRDWLLTCEPRRLARRHLGLAGVFLLIGVIAALLLRVELMTPALDRFSARAFGALLSLHGSILMYVVALPLFPGVMGPALLPRILGREQMAFPRLARLSWQLLGLGGLLMLGVFLRGGTEAGWTFDAEFGGRFLAAGSVAMALGVLLVAGALVALALNNGVTIWTTPRNRIAAGQAPLAQAMLAGSALLLMMTPPLMVCLLLVLADRCAGVALFGLNGGIDPRLYGAIFRGFSAPIAYLLLIYAAGAAWSVLAPRAVAPVRGRAMLPAFLALGVGGCFAGLAPLFKALGAPAAYGASTLVAALVLPACGLILVAVVRALCRGVRQVDAALLFALGFYMLLPVVALGLCVQAIPGSGEYLANTTFATGLMHLLLTATLGMAFLGSLHDVWPELAGRVAPEASGRLSALVLMAGALATFLPQMLLGLRGASFRANAYPPEFQVLQLLATTGSTVLVVGLLLALVTLSRRGASAPAPAQAAP